MQTRRTSLGAELRKKFRSPREAIKALGLDESVLDVRRLALDGANTMKPTLLEYVAITRAARALNPLLAMDAKVNYAPVFKGITTKNIKERRPTIVSDVKQLLKGKTIASDASIDGLTALLDKLEGAPANLDESVSEPQHKAMMAAANGESNLDIPKKVGEEFARADKGNGFDNEFRAALAGKGMSDDDIAELEKIHGGGSPNNALDEDDDEKKDDADDEHDDDADDRRADDEREDDDDEKRADDEKDDDAKDRRGAKDRKGARDRKGAKDKRGAKDRRGAMDSKGITQDVLDKTVKAAVETERKNSTATAEAREFVRPYVGNLPLALDSAEKVLRSAAVALKIEGADTVHESALKTLITAIGRPAGAQPAERTNLATDAASAKSFLERFPDAARIGQSG